jgi:hypothetical protein
MDDEREFVERIVNVGFSGCGCREQEMGSGRD